MNDQTLGLHISWWVRPYMKAMYFLLGMGIHIHPRKIERFAVRYGMKLKVEKSAPVGR